MGGGERERHLWKWAFGIGLFKLCISGGGMAVKAHRLSDDCGVKVYLCQVIAQLSCARLGGLWSKISLPGYSGTRLYSGGRVGQ